MVSPSFWLRCVNSGALQLCHPAIFYTAPSDEVLLSFSLLLRSVATEKTRRAVRAEFPLYGYIP